MSKRGNGDGTGITRHANGKWWQRVTLPDGTRKAFYGETQREVRRKRDEYLDAYRAGRISTDAAQPVGKYLADWLKSHQRRVKTATRVDYERQVEMAAPIHRVRLDKLRPADLQKLYDEMEERGLAPSTIQHVHRVLRIAFRRAVKLGYILRAPTELANPPHEEYRERPTLTADQVRHFLDHTREDRTHALWALCLLQGLRLGEVLGLRWEDVDFDARRITIRHTVQALKGLGIVHGTPKTAKSRRTLDLAPLALAALRARRTQQMAERLAAPEWRTPEGWDGLVFTTTDGRPIHPGSACELLRRRLDAAGLPRVRVHDLRHTYATLLAEAGCELIHVQHALGHSSYHMTANTYTHASKDRLSPATETMGRLFPAARDAG